MDKSREDLEARYLASPSDMVTVAGSRLHVRDTGPRSAPTVILIHGIGSHLQTWDGWAERLDAEFRVVRFDLPGSGLSRPDPQSNYTDERSIEMLLALMAKLNIENAHWIGNSIGGRLAWKLAATHPERVTSLVLVSPDGYASPGFEYNKPADIPFVMNAMKYALPKAMLRSNLAMAYSDPSKLSEDTLQRYHDLMLAPGGRNALLERLRQTILVPPEPLLARITAPVLLLWGVDDKMIPIANAADYERHLQDVQLVPLSSLGHVPQEEDPNASVAEVLAFLRGEFH